MGYLKLGDRTLNDVLLNQNSYLLWSRTILLYNMARNKEIIKGFSIFHIQRGKKLVPSMFKLGKEISPVIHCYFSLLKPLQEIQAEA